MFGTEQLAQIQGWTSLVQAVAAVVVGVAAASISILSYRETRRFTRRDYARELSNAWMQLDQVALSNSKLLRVADSVMHPTASRDVTTDQLQKRWFCYMMLNPLVVTYSGLQDGLLDAERRRGFESELSSLLQDPDLYAVTQSGLYHPSFAGECKRLLMVA